MKKINYDFLKQDKYYNHLYHKYKDLSLLEKAGYFESSITTLDYKLNLLSTPYNKILNHITPSTKNPIVLLSTGGFYPLHDGHIQMMELAKDELTKNGFTVVGGYFSPCHENYVKQKQEYNKETLDNNLYQNQIKIKDHKYFMIDPFEYLYLPDTINFTYLIERLEKYLQKYVDSRIKVVYVCGGDNAEFMYLFEDFGFGCCVNRNNNKQFQYMKENIKSNHIFYIDKSTTNICSTIIRKNNKIIKNNTNDNKCYFIRNDSSFLNLDIKENKIIEFRKELCNLFYFMFDKKMQIKEIDVKEQLNWAKKQLKNKNTISLDVYYKGNYNIQTSRLFSLSDGQIDPIEMISRNKNIELKDQLLTIKKGDYILVDDDSISGTSINNIKKMLPNNVIIKDVFLLSSFYKNDIFDIVDLRDFIIGSENGGLVVKIKKDQLIRVPYCYPYVNPVTRCSIKAKKAISFSKKIWELNYLLYKDTDIKIKDCSDDFQKLMKFININLETKMEEICKMYYNSF